MGESESYWKRHLFGIVQCILAFYCAAIATLERYRPRGIPASGVASGKQVAMPIATHYSMPIWLWLGIVSLALSVIIPAVVGMIRKRKDMPRAELLFPLQVQILQLIRDLREYRISVGALREAPTAKLIREGDNLQMLLHQQNLEMSRWTQEQSEWIRRFAYGYRDRFAKRVEIVMNRLGSEGFVVVDLAPFARDPKLNFNFKALLDILGGFILRLEESQDERSAALELKAQENLAKLVPMPPEPPPFLAPLQVEAIKLSRELKEFNKSQIAYPGEPISRDETSERMGELLLEKMEQVSAVYDQICHAYAAEGFPAKVTSFAHRVGAKGIDVGELEKFSRNVDITNTIKALQDLIWKIEGP